MTAIFGTAPGALADLEVISELGRGAETVVYRVRRHGAEFALKVLSSPDAAQALTAVRREAALLGCVGHPLLPRIFEVGQTAAGPYLIQEFIDGPPLAHRLRRGPLDEGSAVRLAIDLVGPLAAAHRAGLVHRDVKPDNVLIDPSGTARLIDFGLASRGGSSHDTVSGTLLYSAPEQTGMLKRPVDGRSDLYALGVLLFESVTGHLPYYAEDAGDLIRQHATAPVPDARAVRPDLSPTLAEIIHTLMAKDPDDRYQSGDGLLTDLHRLATHPGLAFPVATDDRGVQPIGPELMVGRDDEIVALANRWLRARSGGGGAAVVEGPAGAGKTRLVRELTQVVDVKDHDLVLYGKCVPDDPVPLAPIRGAVERYLRTVAKLPEPHRDHAVQRLTRAAGRGGSLLRSLSPLLADLVQAPEIEELNHHEQFVNAVAAFLIGLADEFQGAVLHIDDVQWLDGPTRRVLQRLTSRLPNTPLLVIATSRDDADSMPALNRFGSDMDATLDTRIPLRPLHREAVIRLVAEHLGAIRLPDGQVSELAARAGGNPFTVGEYIRAVFDAGLITPAWDGWRLDRAGLTRLELSGDAMDLVLQRIDSLGPESRNLLTTGAAGGRWFPTELVATVCGMDPQQARSLLAAAESRRLVIPSGSDGYRFGHDRIREALLAGIDPDTLRALHQRIAEVLDASVPDDPRFVYATARHYALGEVERRPQRGYLSGFAAGRKALAEHAPAEAREFLETAARSAAQAGIVPQPGFFFALGTSCARTGRFAEALEHLDQALQAEPDRMRQAAILAQVALVHNHAWRPDRAFDAVRRGLAALGTPLPRTRLGLAVSTPASVARGLVVGRLGFGSARGLSRERYRMQAILYDIGASAATLRMRRGMRAILSFRALHPINRLGPGPEYARHMSGLALIADVSGRPKLADRLYDKAATAAADVGDPELVGYIEWKRGAGSHLSGRDDDGQVWSQALIEHERWLGLGDYLTGVATMCVQLFKRGRTADAEAWYQRGQDRLDPGAEAEGAAIRAVAAAIAAQLGHAQEATEHVEALRRFLLSYPDNPMQLINLYAAQMVGLIEQDRLGDEFDHLAAEFAALGIEPSALLAEQRVYYIFETLGRLARVRRAPRNSPDVTAAAGEAVERLGKMADTKVLRAFHRVTRADFEVLTGRPQDAVRTLAEVDVVLLPLDAPLVAYEEARVRARALTALDQPGPAAHQAELARMTAADQRWPQRVEWIAAEFGPAEFALIEPGPAEPFDSLGGSLDNRAVGSHGVGSHGIDNRGVGSQAIDNRGIDGRGLGSHGVDNRGIDGRGTGSRGIDNRGIDGRGTGSQGAGSQGIDGRSGGSHGIDNRAVGSHGIDNRAVGSHGIDNRTQAAGGHPRFHSRGNSEITRGPVDNAVEGGGGASLYRRRMEALQQVSLASATVIDPSALARVALDETLRILGAERAYLFLLDRDRQELVPHVGRDGQGNDIQQLTGYSATLVDRVRHSGEPLVVTGSDEGIALGSQSMQAHGLRSILIAPLHFDGQLRGVVYLDSRIAKGVFTNDDVDILKAITNHIAVSLETARAAQLEVAVQAARRQRDVAETLRAAMADQSSSLDPAEVMWRLLTSLTRTVGGDAAVLLTGPGSADRLTVVATHGAGAPVGTQISPVPPDLTDLTGPRVRIVVPGARSPFGPLVGTPRCWWAIQVAQHGEPFGILLVGASGKSVIGEAQAQVAAAIAGQGMTAYENARLFSQVRELATIDGLTGLYNRNHFFAEAGRQVLLARRQGAPVAAIMVDIDHFKRINDTYGHPVGDEVIREVAGRLADALGDGGVLGRYGGEEFAVVTARPGASAEDLAHRLHGAVSGEPVYTAVGLLPVTISVGLAHRHDDQDLPQLLTQADHALYQAKNTGRDRVYVSGS